MARVPLQAVLAVDADTGQRSDFLALQARDPMMEIRAEARKLKQKFDLKSIVIDYLQLMTSGKKVESRQQEVSEFSRQLKLLAKELEVPARINFTCRASPTWPSSR